MAVVTANLSSVDHSDGLTFIIYTIQSDMGGGHLVSGYRLRWSNYTTEACHTVEWVIAICLKTLYSVAARKLIVVCSRLQKLRA